MIKLSRSVIALGTGALIVAGGACSSTTNKAGGSTTSDAGAGGAGDSGAGDSGAADGGPAARTSAACGSVPILGDFGPNTPSACASCVDSTCCSEAMACSGDSVCKTYRDCVLACAGAATCIGQCAVDGGVGPAQTALAQCISVKCADCVDLTCVSKPLEAPTVASVTIPVRIVNFLTGAAVPGATIKVCAYSDTSCTSPSDQGTTDSNGSVMLTIQTAPGGYGGYFEVTGAGLQPQLNYPRARGVLNNQSSLQFPALDMGTSAAYWQLLTGSPLPDGGSTTSGSLAFQAQSCGNAGLAGVTVESSNAGTGAVTAYIVNGTPSTTATMTGPSGQGGFAPHQPGPTRVSMKDSKGNVLGSADVNVRIGWYTSCSVPPGP